jgi:Arc/MetJ family transcription regulator
MLESVRKEGVVARVRKNYWLDPVLVEQAKAALGTTTETETVAEALRRVAEGEELARALAEGRGAYPMWADPYHDDAPQPRSSSREA